MTILDPSWYKTWFENPAYSSVYAHRDNEDAKLIVKLITDFFESFNCKNYNSENSNSEKILLDLGSGNGRHAILLNEKFDNVISLDLSRTLLLNARENFKSLKDKNIPLAVRSDYRKLPLANNSIDIICSLFTSFGYFETDLEHTKLLEEWSNTLKQDGVLVLDLPNLEFVKTNLVKENTSTISGKEVTERRSFQVTPPRVNKSITFYPLNDSEETEVFNESVRLYTLQELIKLCSISGLELVKTYGSYDKEDYIELTSPRMILFFKKIFI